MVKKRLELSIEEGLLKKAKKDIPNLSKFMEDMLHEYFDCDDKEGHMLRAKKSRYEDEMKQIRTQIAVIDEMLFNREHKETLDNEEVNRVWIKLIGFKINGMNITDTLLIEGVEVLGLESIDELNSMLETLSKNKSSLDGLKLRKDYEYAQEQYNLLK
ncbi:hypothetical protein [Methanobrevibacter sp. DSM 116169]|uniref:hypothetical protein n=1 Tax=Methanobrevibacter sp. DSM 116169 TaxID=3242727 RepID=UPI0038FD336C